ncbi:hypothetical protein QTP88_016309 [Uroleucon formosanum]
MAFSKYNLMKIALIIDEEEEMRQSKRSRRFWVHPLVQTREEEGEYTTLYPQLVNDDVKFYKYFPRFQFRLCNLDQKSRDCRGLDRASTGRDLIGPDRDLTVTDSVYDSVGLRTTDVDLIVTGPNRDR